MFSATVLHISAGAIICEVGGPGLHPFLRNRFYMIFNIYIWSISIVQARILCCLCTEQIRFDISDAQGDLQSVLNSEEKLVLVWRVRM
jgi:hypothetical protein